MEKKKKKKNTNTNDLCYPLREGHLLQGVNAGSHRRSLTGQMALHRSERSSSTERRLPLFGQTVPEWLCGCKRWQRAQSPLLNTRPRVVANGLFSPVPSEVSGLFSTSEASATSQAALERSELSRSPLQGRDPHVHARRSVSQQEAVENNDAEELRALQRHLQAKEAELLRLRAMRSGRELSGLRASEAHHHHQQHQQQPQPQYPHQLQPQRLLLASSPRVRSPPREDTTTLGRALRRSTTTSSPGAALAYALRGGPRVPPPPTAARVSDSTCH